MKIKQQKQIKAFLIEEFGEERGSALFAQQADKLTALIKTIGDKSENQRKTLIQTILPRVALYQALSQEALPGEDVEATMRKYMQNIVAAEKHAATAKLEAIPGFYFLYSKAFLRIMRTSDLWESTQAHDKDHFEATITKCLWHTACVEAGCPALCRLFCDVDDVTYGGLKKLGFSRTRTLGYGEACCDFHFFKK